MSKTQAPNENQAPKQTPAPTVDLTPLGGPVNGATALLRDQDSLKWHLNYWLDLYTIAIISGQDMILMAARIDKEHEEITDLGFRAELKDNWYNFLLTYSGQVLLHWNQTSLNSEEAKMFLSDIDRLLENKGKKMRDYICMLVILMNEHSRREDEVNATKVYRQIRRLIQRMRQEEARDAEAEGSDA